MLYTSHNRGIASLLSLIEHYKDNNTHTNSPIMKRQSTISVAVSAFVGLMLLGASSQNALAAVTFDPETGEGFVGKGDVQEVFGWNNKGLQDNAKDVQFRVSSGTESSWECYNSNNEKTQVRSQSVTFEGVFDSESRTHKQVDGFNLLGYDGNPTTITDGPPFESCPANPSTWSLVEGSTQTTQTPGGLQVSIDGIEWYDLA
jgi:hypothetical protein